jgi:hypothetical protein
MIFVFLYERIERSDVSEISGVSERNERIEKNEVIDVIEKIDVFAQNDEAMTRAHCSHLQNWQPS